MKKLCLILALFSFFGFLAFGDPNEQEEIDFLLFLPNSGNEFVNEEQAAIQLDNLAKYLLGRNLVVGQIYVYGYAAFVVNNIEATDLSRDRALFVINELQRRGLAKDLFSEPVAYGEVALWGSNENEAERSPNRRVRIMLDGDFLMSATLVADDSEIEASSAADDEKTVVQEELIEDAIHEEPIHKEPISKSNSKFPWWILLLLIIIAAILFLLSRRKKSSIGELKLETLTENEPIPAPVPLSYITVNLDEEIRVTAYGLCLQRGGQNGDAQGDWYAAVRAVSARYEAEKYQVHTEAGSWWARRSSSRQ
jgi:hypothetical protein